MSRILIWSAVGFAVLAAIVVALALFPKVAVLLIVAVGILALVARLGVDFCQPWRHLALLELRWNQADELERLVGRILELVLFIRRNEQDMAGLEWHSLAIAPDAPGAFQYKNFMFVGMAMQGSVALGSHFKDAQCKILRTVPG